MPHTSLGDIGLTVPSRERVARRRRVFERNSSQLPMKKKLTLRFAKWFTPFLLLQYHTRSSIENTKTAFDGHERVAPQEGEPERHDAKKTVSHECLDDGRDKEEFGDSNADETERERDEIIFLAFYEKQGNNTSTVYTSEDIIVLNQRDEAYHQNDGECIKKNNPSFSCHTFYYIDFCGEGGIRILPSRDWRYRESSSQIKD